MKVILLYYIKSSSRCELWILHFSTHRSSLCDQEEFDVAEWFSPVEHREKEERSLSS